MGVFKLPLTLCDDFMQIIRKYWWGAENGHRKTHWCSWKQCYSQRVMVDCASETLRLFNEALLGPQAWRLLLYPDICVQSYEMPNITQGEIYWIHFLVAKFHPHDV
jgi:hypothetical protein